MKEQKPDSIDGYLAQFPKDIQERLVQIRAIFKTEFPQVEESIRYNMAAFKLGKEHLYMAAYKKHIGMYPMYHPHSLEAALAPYRGKGTKDALHFPYDQPLPLELISQIVRDKLPKNN